QEGETLWQWLEQGACFYVCGDASRMAKDVDKDLVALVAKWGQKSLEDAVAYVDAMRKDKRYQRDVY
ncbi:MAG: sulfite reductase [NADPH] flavoprotein alpha-component, partial [Akkermansia sp.]